MPVASARAAADAELDALAATEAANPAAALWLNKTPGPGAWAMAPWQRAVALDPSRRILIRKGNKVGDSCLAHWTIKAFLDGWHPTIRRPRGPVTALYLAADLDGSYKDDVSKRLREFFRDADLSPRCSYDRARGFIVAGARGIETRGGDMVIFRSGTQATLASAGLSAGGVDSWMVGPISSGGLVIVNEPPRQHIWSETMRAAAEFGATVFANFTPLPPESLVGRDDLRWLREYVEDPARGWSEHVVPLRPETAPHRTPESIAQQIADMFAWERPQRRDAAWEGPAPARTLANWTDDQVWSSESWDDLPGAGDGEIRLALCADHGELGGHEVVLLLAWQGRGRDARVWAVDEYVSPERTTIRQDAAGVLRMLARRGLTVEQLDECVGDVNTAGKSALTTVNDELTRELSAQSGQRCPRFMRAAKGPGSVALGVRILDDALGTSRLWVHDRCGGLRRALRRWQGEDDDHKHWLDALRYGAVPHLEHRRSAHTPRLRVG